MRTVPISIAWVLLCALSLSAAMCQQVNPVGAANTNDLRAYAMHGTYVIFSGLAADIAEQEGVPDRVALALIEAEERAGPVAKKIVAALIELEDIRKRVSLGETTEQKVTIALGRLGLLSDELAPLVNQLVDLVLKARGEEE